MRLARPIALATALLAVDFPAHAGTRDVPATAVEGTAGAAMNDYLARLVPFGFHGTALVAQRGNVVLHQAYGVADPTTGRPNTTATLFSTGSVTKQFTATAIMKLASEGRLSTDDPMSRYIDGVPDDKRGITLHHLLTHTAGLLPSYGPDTESVARDDFVRRVLHTPLDHPPGETYEYSNAGFTLLAVIVENVTGMPYEDYLRRTLYLPNGMTHTGLTSLDVKGMDVARAHNAGEGFPSAADRPRDAWNLYGNGGQLSTTGDMYRWVRALRAGRLVPPEYRDRMFTRYADEDPDGRCGYGYGWSICDTRRGGDVVWHNGGSTGLWSCAVYQYVDDDAIFIVFTNSTMDGRSPVDRIAINLSRILFGESVDTPPDLSKHVAVDVSPLAGVYALDDGGSFEVTPAANGVAVAPAGQAAMTALFPSPMGDILADANDRTRKMIELIRNGNFDRAGEYVEMEVDADRTAADFLREWWESVEGITTLGGVDLLGARIAGDVQTWIRLRLADRSQTWALYWMMGRCVGIAPAPAPARTLRAVSPRRFVTFGLESGTIVVEFGPDGTMTLRSGDAAVVARRRG